MSIAPYFEDIRLFLSNSSDFLGAMHMNLQADNAYLWKDEEGDLDAGIFDWCLELKGFFSNLILNQHNPKTDTFCQWRSA